MEYQIDDEDASLSIWSLEETERLKTIILKHNKRNWPLIARHFPSHTVDECQLQFELSNPHHTALRRGQWSYEEDVQLLSLVEKMGKKWSSIAEAFPYRTSSRIRERYMNYLCPDLQKKDEEWTEEEDRILMAAQDEMGNRWTAIARVLPGRGSNMIKNRWYFLHRREMAMQAGVDVRILKRKRLDGETKKWSSEESGTLEKLVKKYGPKQWILIAAEMEGRTDNQCLHHWQYVLNSDIIKGKGSWTVEEDMKLSLLVKEFGPKWSKIAQELPGRRGKQIRERWNNTLDPSLKKGPWTDEEETKLVELQQVYWNKWSAISKFLPGRSANSIKNQWYSAVSKRQQASEEAASKDPEEHEKETTENTAPNDLCHI